MLVDETARIAKGAQIDSSAKIGPWCVIGENAKIGANTILHGNNYLDGDVTIGNDCQIYPFAVIGTPPQHTNFKGDGTKTIIGNHNIIREYVVIHRAIESHDGFTKIGDNNMLMLGTHIGHDCVIGSHVILAPHVLVGGHVIVEDNVTLGGNSSVHQFARIGTGAMIGAGSYIRRDVIPFALVNNAEGNLAGLNIVGLKRRGYQRQNICNARHAYQQLFIDNVMAKAIAELQQNHRDCPIISEILRFITAPSKRNFARPTHKSQDS
ncbi:MAG: acyl-ACP--UDP-N-acetylglucosamine O-acyltransferase [Alphaproteobacteria bacterium]|nr:acyl-ACP--UDP-N-acetylglucosamine O-acyltransferase [Alphaproteobacteria bacterium]